MTEQAKLEKLQAEQSELMALLAKVGVLVSRGLW